MWIFLSILFVTSIPHVATQTCYKEHGMVLSGFADVVIDVSTLQQCILECGRQTPKCLSGMYYHSDGTCILNSENKQTQPEYFGPETDDQVVTYFDGCSSEADSDCQCAEGDRFYDKIDPTFLRKTKFTDNRGATHAGFNGCVDYSSDTKCRRYKRLDMCQRMERIARLCPKTCGRCS